MTRISKMYQDLAIVIAWPGQTARGDEQWMALLKKIGIVKNLNFKVGHAAIILVQHLSGALTYYDFGRYLAPRGEGRARSAHIDPRLRLFTKAVIEDGHSIANLPEIMAELQQMEEATHGGGDLYFSIAKDLSYPLAKTFSDQLVNRGPIKYGAIARGNNSCSRFVAQVLLAAYTPEHKARKHIFFPETMKPSPMSNVVNSTTDRQIYCYSADGRLTAMRMTRYQSLRFQLELLSTNLSAVKAATLPCDEHAGYVNEPERPLLLPEYAQWVGGIGEGAWFLLSAHSSGVYHITRYNVRGETDYGILCTAASPIDLNKPYRFTYDCHYHTHLVEQEKERITFTALTAASLSDSEEKLIEKEL